MLLFRSQRYIREDDASTDYVMYDLDELDLNWLESVNAKRKFRGILQCVCVCVPENVLVHYPEGVYETILDSVYCILH